MNKQKKTIRVRPTSEYPCQWDDLLGPHKKVVATIYTYEEGRKENLKPGISKGKDGIYDIVSHSGEINNEIVRNGLKELGKITGSKYVFVSPRTIEDRIISYAESLMKPLKKYGNAKKGYDFSKAKTAKQKAEVIGIWFGEILYEALTYKDVETVKSLAKTIKMEIEDLIKEA